MQSEGYLRQTQGNQQQDIVGIGCEIELLGDYHAISHVHVDGPANSAGLQQGCILRAVDYRPVKGFDTPRLQSMILGPRMSKVILTIQRPGYDEIEDITVVRCYQDKSHDGLNPIGFAGEWFGKVFGIFQPAPVSTLAYTRNDRPAISNERHVLNSEPRRSYPVRASALETSGPTRPITYPVTSSPAVDRINREEEVQQGIDRLRAQTSHAALALDSVVDDILKRRMQRINALEQTGRPNNSDHSDRITMLEPPIGKSLAKSSDLVGKSNGSHGSKDLHFEPKIVSKDLQFEPRLLLRDHANVSPSESVGPYHDADPKLKKQPEVAASKPPKSILSVSSHPLLYRSPADDAARPTTIIAADEASEDRESSKQDLQQCLRSMEDAIRALHSSTSSVAAGAAQALPDAPPPRSDGQSELGEADPHGRAGGGTRPLESLPPQLVSVATDREPRLRTDPPSYLDSLASMPAADRGFSGLSKEVAGRDTGPPIAPTASAWGANTLPVTAANPDPDPPPQTVSAALGRRGVAGVGCGAVGEFLRVDVLQARDLPKMDVLTGSSDPYCQVQLGDATVVTKSIKQTTNPLWNESFTFPLDADPAGASTAELRITVFDWNRLMKHSPMGELAVPLRDIRLDETGRGMPAWYPLSRPEHGSAKSGGGSIYLQFSSSPMPAVSVATQKPNGPGDSPARTAPSESLPAGGPFPSATAPSITSPVPPPASATAPAALASPIPSRDRAAQSPVAPPQVAPAAAPAAPVPSALSTPARPAQASIAPDATVTAQPSPAAAPTPSVSVSPAAGPPQSAVGAVSPLAGGGAGSGAGGAGTVAGGGGLEPLAEGWQENWSKTKGKPYYSNKLTGETRWTRPTLAPGSGTKRLM